MELMLVLLKIPFLRYYPTKAIKSEAIRLSDDQYMHCSWCPAWSLPWSLHSGGYLAKV